MKKIILSIILGATTAYGFAQSGWSVNSANYNLDLAIVGQLNFQGNASQNIQDEVAAFDSQGNIRGVATVAYNATVDDYLVNLTVFSNANGDSIWFKMYDAANDTIVDAINEPIVFVPNDIIGTVSNPYPFYDSNLPTDITLDNNTVTENNGLNTYVGDLITHVPNNIGATFTYSLVTGAGDTDNGSFALSGGSVFIQDSANYETDSTYTIRVKSVSNLNDSLERIVEIFVLDANDTPTSIAISNDSILETAFVGDTIGLFSTTDEDTNAVHVYTIEQTPFTDFDFFSIDGNALEVAQALDYEQHPQLEVDITSTDAGGESITQRFVIHVKDVYEPTSVLLDNLTIQENDSIGSLVGMLSNDGVSFNYTYTLIAGTGDDDNANFSISGNELRTATDFNFEAQVTNPMSVLVQSTDGLGFNEEQVFTITLLDINEAPDSITISNDSIAENAALATVIGTLGSMDDDAGNTHSYTIEQTPFTDYNAFVISGNGLQLNTALDYELKSEYIIDITSTDQGGESYTQQLTIYVQDVYEPTNIQITNQSVNENEATGTLIGTLSNDGSSNGFTYTLVAGTGDDDNGSFAISNNELETASSFDFESLSANPLSVLVQSTDGNGNTELQQFSILVEDVNEAPTLIQISNDSIMENATVGDTIGLLSTVDEDITDQFTYSIEPTPFTDHADFAIVNNALRTFIPFDYETQTVHTIDITSTDASGASITQTFNIYIKDEAGEINTVIELAEEQNTTLYPNPSNGNVVLEIMNFEFDNKAEVSIINAVGQTVYQSNIQHSTFNISLEEPNGLYFMNIKMNDKTTTKRLVISK